MIDPPLRDTCQAQEFFRLRHDYWLAYLLLRPPGLQTVSVNPHHQYEVTTLSFTVGHSKLPSGLSKTRPSNMPDCVNTALQAGVC